MLPVEPVAPIAPVEPVEPVLPVGPVAPMFPATAKLHDENVPLPLVTSAVIIKVLLSM
jgi:hypothetical protein